MNLLTIDLRVKNSAPRIDPRCSAHARVRALSLLPARNLDDSPSPKRYSKSRRAKASNFQHDDLTPSSSNDDSQYCTDQQSGYDGEYEDDFSSETESRCCEAPHMLNLTPPAAVASGIEQSPVPMSILDESPIRSASPLCSDDPVYSGKKGELTNFASSNLEQAEYEELLRVYREKVW